MSNAIRLVCLLALIAAGVAPLHAADVLRDPGFENRAQDVWGIHLQDAGPGAAFGYAGGTGIAPHGGKGLLRFSGGGFGDVWQRIDPALCQAGRRYTFKGWVYPAAGDLDQLLIKFGFEAKYGDRVDYSGLRELIAGNLKKGEWNPVETTFVTGGDKPEQMFAKLMVFAKGQKPDLLLCFDDVQVTIEDQKAAADVPDDTPDTGGVELTCHAEANGKLALRRAGNDESILNAAAFSGIEITDLATGKTERVAAPARAQGPDVVLTGRCEPLQLNVAATLKSVNGAIRGQVKIEDLGKMDRTLVARVVLGLSDGQWNWHPDLNQRAAEVQAGRKYFQPGSFAGHELSAYPFAAVSRRGGPGLAIGWPMENPRFYRLQCQSDEAGKVRCVIEADLGLAAETSRFPHAADFEFVVYGFERAGGFRAALSRYYELHPAAFRGRDAEQGLWTLWIQPGMEEYAKRFGVAYHQAEYELDANGERLAMDKRNGFQSFTYTEPWGFWHPLPPELVNKAGAGASAAQPGTSEKALNTEPIRAFVKADVGSTVISDRFPAAARGRVAEAILNSAIWKNPQGEWAFYEYRSGGFNWGTERKGWDSVIILANSDPDLARPNRADISWENQVEHTAALARNANGEIRGVMLDSLMFFLGWDRFNFRRDHWAVAEIPLTFTRVDGKYVPAQAAALANIKFLKRNYAQAHAKNWSVLVNSWNPLYPYVGAFADIFGAGEYGDAGKVAEAPQDALALFRALAFRKPISTMDYVLHFDKCPATPENLERIIEPRINYYLMYGIYPGTANSWTKEREPWLKLLCPVFEKYVPICRTLNQAGWEPLTAARAEGDLLLERWGGDVRRGLYFTVYNLSFTEARTSLVIDSRRISWPVDTRVTELLGGAACAVERKDEQVSVALRVPARRTIVIECRAIERNKP